MKGLLPSIESVPWSVILAGPLFCLLFVGICLWVYRRGGKAAYRDVEQLPLEEFSAEESNGG